ncbi:Asp-tRNA(Asn)/Glu-tRNA(Gln) amidotransferase subunit GatA [Halolamina litorea]|uniref:amidase n=1 Tax=Halolamina litorea TaxID=1515593 RepID=UPI00226ED8D6|nr:amidase family protein [Halolamina litorea]
MPPQHTPNPAALRQYAERLSLSIDGDEAAALAEQFAEQDAVLDALDALVLDDPPERDYWDPDPEEDELGGWLTRCDVARDGVGGPLDGLTVGVKDNVAVAGVPMTCGSPLLTDPAFVPARDATVVDRLLDAGARITGKTNMDEFAFGGSRESLRFRLARNPRDPERQPGSSSAGSGVVAATGEVDLAIGSDTGGSIRFPAAWSGVPGIKPTRGLVSHDGFVQYAKTLDNVGFLAPSVENLALGLDAVAGPDPRDERTCGHEAEEYAASVADADPAALTIGLPEELFGKAPDLDEVVREAVDELEAAGASVRSVSITDYDYWLPAWLGIGMTEVGNYLASNATNYWSFSPGDPELAARLQEARVAGEPELGASLQAAMLYAEHRTATDGDAAYALAHEARRRVAAGVDGALAEVDVLASPTVPKLAPTWDEAVDDLFGALSNTGPFNVTGHPAVSVPCGTVDELPVGLQFIAPRGADATALRAGAAWTGLDG